MTKHENSDSPLRIYNFGRYTMALFDIFGHNEIFTDTGEDLYFTKPFTIPAGSSASVILPAANMGVAIAYAGRLVDGVWVEGVDLHYMTTEPGEQRIMQAGSTYVLYSKQKSDLQRDIYYTMNYTDIVIKEPIGFDSLKMTLKRHDLHGMGAEVSLGNLEFYGLAFDVIKSAYETDIDSEIIYEIEADGDILYSGKIDLSTYSVKQGDYQSVSVKVGEIGVKTTFNNRIDTEVDLNTPKTIDGDTVEAPEWLNLHIPFKHLLYTNKSEQKIDETITNGGGYAPFDGKIFIGDQQNCIFIPIGDVIVNEFGDFEKNVTYTTDTVDDSTPKIYTANINHEQQFGIDTIASIDIVLKAELLAFDGWNPMQDNYIRWQLMAIDIVKGEFIAGEVKSINKLDIDWETQSHKGTPFDLSCELHGELPASESIKYFLKFDIDLGTATAQYFGAHITIKRGSFVKMTMYDNLTEDTPVNADMLLVHDALNVVSHAISENALAVKSDWYKTPESTWNAGSIGAGALKALTNGYHIRGLFSDGDIERNMPMSFKSLIESLNAQDCIGWGFATENGELCIRVERWQWFYKDTVILSLTDVAEVQIDIDPDRIPTELKIGYKKYATNDQYNSIDSPHGMRTFVSGIKAVSKTETQECNFIADNYAIEEMRRASYLENETKETTYDESIFIFELTEKQGVYSIGHTAYNAENVGNPKEFINAKLTPRHMASRWKDYIFAANNTTSFKFTTGELNYKASFLVLPEYLNAVHSLKPFLGMATAASENEDIAYEHAIFVAEKITFSYPLTIAQYKQVKDNPYGLISVNGRLGWILDFKYSFADGMADFVLLQKYE